MKKEDLGKKTKKAYLFVRDWAQNMAVFPFLLHTRGNLVGKKEVVFRLSAASLEYKSDDIQ